MTTATTSYPWYEPVEGDEIRQGDILPGCPVFCPPDDLASGELPAAVFRSEEHYVVVMTQSCDMDSNHPKVKEILLCDVMQRSAFKEGPPAQDDWWEEARKGRRPAFHVLAGCTLSGLERGPAIVDFRRVYSLPMSFVQTLALERKPRLRLRPPYREHLSQAFARFFMRVGLPVDIPPFTRQ